MKVRAILDILCLSHNSCCDVVFCFSTEQGVRNRNLRSRIIYVTFFFLITLGIMLTRTYAELFLLPVFSTFDCTANLQILTCFQVNILLRLSGALFAYHLILAILSIPSDDISIMVNEGFWVMKFLGFASILFFNMFIPLQVWVIYGVFAKFISILTLALQLIILNDSILIFCEAAIIPFKNSGKFGMITTIIFGYIVPIVVNLAIFGYNFFVYTPICSPYLLINMIILLLIFMLIIINLMRLLQASGPLIAALYFTLFVGIMNNSMLSSTPHSACVIFDAAGNASTSVSYANAMFDGVLSLVLLTVGLAFLCIVTKKDAKTYSYYAESWLYFFILREVGNSYMKYAPKKKGVGGVKGKGEDEKNGKDKRKKVRGKKNFRGVEISRAGARDEEDENGLGGVLRDIANQDVVRKTAVGTYKIPDDFYPDRVKFRSKQAFFFHLLMTLLGAYCAVIFTSWINITVSDIRTGTESYDNTSIWARFVGITLGVIFSSVKVFRAHYHFTRAQEETEEYRELDDSDL